VKLMRGERGKQVSRQKQSLRNGLLRVGVIWEVPKTQRYPDGIRYRLALVHPETGKILVLFDNHFPKGHHRHYANGTEAPYHFQSVLNLVEDYLQAVKEESNED